ncbi:PucR family transcriptional regulator [Rhodococcus rhodnii]|uniref:PucR C-terminal helix-turn-helix domain-containing protein n=2 Tax=Rhodococcus rhodnii TaxID=38312 RepID=R7WJ12_9NOCA|nr:hypothetical protein Rrhod_3456 [Rhodococcus rhodnii LMG 5362]TXG89255.1 PucR family transcriptional regulator [Rhodococcus rhodnii]
MPVTSTNVPHTANAVSLRELLGALDTAVVFAPAGHGETPIATLALVETGDLATELESHTPLPDLYLLVGTGEAETTSWFGALAERPSELRPRAVMSKHPAHDGALADAAHRAGIALVAVHPKARWEHVFGLLGRMLDRSRVEAAMDPDLAATDTDLFGLAQIVAQNAGGMVSIEDAQANVLAYSPSDDSADELRRLSILGREGPRDYLRALRTWGVYDRMRESDDVIDVPAHAALGTERRLVVGIRRPAEGGGPAPHVLGSIWLQQGHAPFAPDAEAVLRGAAAIAARIVTRTRNAPSAEGVLIQRLFGARGSGVDVPSVSAALGIAATGPAAVIGFAPTGPAPDAGGFAELGSVLRLHASSFRRDSVSTVIGDRAYVLLPEYQSATSIAAWTRALVEQFETKRAIVLRAAIAVPVPDLGHVASARLEVDRVLDGTAATFPDGRVTTLAESRTPVLLGEIVDLVAADPQLRDPRLDALIGYDEQHASSLCASAAAYLSAYGDVRAAATALRVHPNTLRYRIRRVQEIVGIDLQDASDRLLFEIQLRAHGRTA